MSRRAKGASELEERQGEDLERVNAELRQRIAELEHIQAALQDSEDRYRSLFENAIDLIQIVAPDGKLLFVNEAWRRKFGYDPREVPNLSIFDLIAPDCGDHCVNTFSAVLANGLVENIETTFVAKDGSRIELQGNAKCTYDVEGKPISSQCIFQDVTAQKEREFEALRADKIASLGVLAGGIAHDFNNFLTAILGNISLVRTRCDDDEAAVRCLSRAERASIRAQGLTQQLLTFAKGGGAVKRAADLAPLIRESAEFATRGSKNLCECRLAENLWPAEIDTGQISQTIHNLVINANQAMSEGGTIIVRADNVVLTDEAELPLAAGNYVRIEIEDRGHGISAQVLEHIFDPYFTTKEAGSGLGLAVTYSVVRNHRGHISVRSRVGNGTTFTIYLPASADALVTHTPHPDGTPEGHGRVLLMDDDPMIRDLVAEMLSALGYEAEVAADGKEALEMHAHALDEGRAFDLLLFDLTVPGGMGGDKALKKIRETSPDAKAIITSGYARDRRALELIEAGFAEYLQKPYDLGTLGRVLKEVLAGD